MATQFSGPVNLDADELLQALREEIARLPEKLRQPVILCDLQLIPRGRAASELRLSERTLLRRLRDARARLKARLVRRGLANEEGMLGAMLLREARTPLPAAWAETTSRAALATLNSTMTVGLISASAQQWTQEVLEMMFASKLMGVSVVLLVVGLASWGVSAALIAPRAERSTTSAPSPAASSKPRPKAEPGQLLVRGRVVDPDGRPIAGAKLYQTRAMGYLKQPFSTPQVAMTGPDGRFAFTISDAKYREGAFVVAAEASDFGAGWVKVLPVDKSDDLTLPLVVDDVPITGQIVDLEGKPVVGATLRLIQINASPEEDLVPWIEALKKTPKKDRLRLEQEFLPRFTIAPLSQVTTDVEGRFRLTGIGRNRLATIQLDGPTIVSQHLHVLTRPEATVEIIDDSGEVTRYYGSSFRHAVAPTKPIIGQIRDRDTKQPLGGITVQSEKLANSPYHGVDIVQTTTDAEGRYRLTGMPKGTGNKIKIHVGEDRPYPIIAKDVPDTPGLAPVTVDFELKRGVWIEGKLTDAITGKPVQGSMEYYAFSNNPNRLDYPGFDGAAIFRGIVSTKEDGSYRIIGLPGPGLIAVFHLSDYLRAPERDDEHGAKEPHLNTSPYVITHPINYSAIARIDVPKGVESAKRQITVDPGRSFSGTVLDPDGKPLSGAQGLGLNSSTPPWDRAEGRKSAQFTVRAFNPHQPRDLLLRHREKGLIGVVHPPAKDQGDSVIVQMQPGATITGRLVDGAGRPRPGVELAVSFRSKQQSAWQNYFPDVIKTDPEGRFRVEALVPGYTFQLWSDRRGDEPIKTSAPSSGQVKDLGDVWMEGKRD